MWFYVGVVNSMDDNESLTELLNDNNGSSSCEEDKEDEGNSSKRSKPVLKDSYNIAYIMFILLALGLLTPYQSYLAALDYFTYLYPSHRPELVLPSVNLAIALLIIAVTIGVMNYFPLHLRIGFGYMLFMISLSMIILLDIGVHNCSISNDAGFALTLLLFMIAATGSGIQQASLYGLCGMLPEKYTQALMFGEAIAGSIVALNRIITKGSSGQERTGALIFFGISLLYIIACVGFQVVVWRSKFVRQYVRDNTSKRIKASEIKICRCLKRKDSNDDTRNESNEIQLQSYKDEVEESQLQSYKDKDEMGAEHGGFINTIKNGLFLRYRIVKKIWRHMLSVFLIFFVTLLVFPGITSDVQYCQIGDWTIIIHVSLFNFSDTITRFLCLLPHPFGSKSLIFISILRFILVPLLVLCVMPSPTHPIFSPPFNLVVSTITVTVIGATNGYFGTLGMQQGPTMVPSVEKELAGGIMVLTLLGGLFVGSIMAYIWTPLMSLDTYMPCSNNDTEVFTCSAT